MKNIISILFIIISSYSNINAQIWEGIIMNGGDSSSNKLLGFTRNFNNKGSFMVGAYKGVVDFGVGQRYVSQNSFNGYITYYHDPTLTFAKWLIEIGGVGNQFVKGIELDRKGNFFTIGTFDTSIYFRSHTKVSQGYKDLYIAKYDTFGQEIWAKTYGSINDEDLTSLSLDSLGNIIITGIYTGSISFGGVNLTNQNNPTKPTSFVAKFNSNGDCIWAKSIYSNFSRIADVITDQQNNIILLSGFKGDFAIDNVVISSNNDEESYALTKLNSSAEVQWSKRITGRVFEDNLPIGSICLDETSSIYMTGSCSDLFNNADIIVAKYNSNGLNVWEKKFGAEGDDKGKDIKYYNGYLTLLGFYDKQVSFDGYVLKEECSTDNESFVSNLFASNGLTNGVEEINNFEGGTDKMYLLALDGIGNISFSGILTKSALLGFDWSIATSFNGARFTVYMGTTVLGTALTLSETNIYPNPVGGSFLFIENHSSESYEIYNTEGKALHIGIVENGKIDVSKLSSGLYFLKTTRGVARFIK